MSVFFRTTMHRDTIYDGGLFSGAIYFSMVIILFNGFTEVSMLVAKLPVLYKHRDLSFYPSWAYTLPSWVLSIPTSLMEAGLWVAVTYYVIGYDPNITRYIKIFMDFSSNFDVCMECITFLEVVFNFSAAFCRFSRQFLLYFFLHQMSIALFRVIGSLGRHMIVANTFGSFAMLVVMALGGYIISRGNQYFAGSMVIFISCY